MIRCLTLDEARDWFGQLPRDRQLATLSPDYVAADALRDPRLQPFFFGYRADGNIWLHGVHRAAVPELDIVDQQSPYGYGGPVSNGEVGEFLADAWASYQHKCVADDVLAEFVRLHPVAASWQSYGGSVRVERDTVLVDTTGDIRSRYSVRCRTAVRKAEKAGLTVGEEGRNMIATRFADFYRDGMRAIRAEAFYLFNDDYFLAMEKWVRVRLMVCRNNGTWLAAGLFLFGGDIVEYHLSATTEEGRRLAATNLLLDHAAHLARDEGLSGLYLGGGTDSDPQNSLLFFKRGFSDKVLPFRIGSSIFQKQRYEMLKAAHEFKGMPNSRTLFYRG